MASGEPVILLVGGERLAVVPQQEVKVPELGVGFRLHREPVAGFFVVVAVIRLVPLPVLDVGLYYDSLQVLDRDTAKCLISANSTGRCRTVNTELPSIMDSDD